MNLNQPKIDIILGTLVLINPIKPKFKRRHSSRDYNLWVKVDGHDRGHFHWLICGFGQIAGLTIYAHDDRRLLQELTIQGQIQDQYCIVQIKP